jgi:hypothetical protein
VVPLLALIALGMVAILLVALRMAIDLRAIRDERLPDIYAALMSESTSYRPGTYHLPHMPPDGLDCFAVWEWLDDVWRLVTHNLPPGADLGPPPSYRGAHKGETIKAWIPGPRR